MQSHNTTEHPNENDNFSNLPPFPSDVPTAPLLRLSLGKLLAGDTHEFDRLFQASVDIGFFYLDFRDSELGTSLLKDVDDLFGVGEKLFDLSLEEKKKYDFSAQNSYYGYKGQGTTITDKDGNLDRNEFYNVSKDDMLGVSEELPSPEVLQQNRSLLASFMSSSHEIVTLVLRILNTKLDLPEDTLTNMHRINAPSGDQVRWIKAPPQPISDRRVALGQHTDFGSVTVLMNRLGGLQVQLPGEKGEWVYVRPLPGHAIINLGDAMVKFTNGLLRSNIHRVNAPPGLQANSTRYSLVYFARPEDSVVLRRLEGVNIPALGAGQVEEEVSSKEWIIRRALGRRVDLGKEIDYEKSAGTEEMSRRIKV